MKRPDCRDCYFYEQIEGNGHCNNYDEFIIETSAYECSEFLDKEEIRDKERNKWQLEMENARLSEYEKFTLPIFNEALNDEKLQEFNEKREFFFDKCIRNYNQYVLGQFDESDGF